MFEGLIELLMEWLAIAWCWILEQLFILAIFCIKFVSELFPDYSIPSFLQAWEWNPVTLGLLVLFFPFDTFFLAISIILAVEFVTSVGIPIYRAFMDLL